MPIANLRSLAVQRAPLRELNLNMLLGGPVLALPMQEGGGGTVYDISGFGNDGAFGAGAAAPTWYQLPSGLWVLSFDGDDLVDCGADSSILPDAYTAIIWSKWDSTSDDYLFAFGGAVDGNNGLGVYLSRPYLFLNSDGNWAYFPTATATVLTNGDWHMAAFVLPGAGQNDALTARFNLDGAEIALAGTNVTQPQKAKHGLRIGNRRNYNYFDGLIGLVRICNRVLTPLEIQNHYNREKHYFDIYDGNVLARLAELRSLAVVR